MVSGFCCVEILQAFSLSLCAGLRLTSCKSGKDRTGMSATLEQVNILAREFDLADSEYQRALDTLRRLLHTSISCASI